MEGPETIPYGEESGECSGQDAEERRSGTIETTFRERVRPWKAVKNRQFRNTYDTGP